MKIRYGSQFCQKKTTEKWFRCAFRRPKSDVSRWCVMLIPKLGMIPGRGGWVSGGIILCDPKSPRLKPCRKFRLHLCDGITCRTPISASSRYDPAPRSWRWRRTPTEFYRPCHPYRPSHSQIRLRCSWLDSREGLRNCRPQ